MAEKTKNRTHFTLTLSVDARKLALVFVFSTMMEPQTVGVKSLECRSIRKLVCGDFIGDG